MSYKLEEDITENYIKRLSKLGKEELTEFIHFLEERIYHIIGKKYIPIQMVLMMDFYTVGVLF
ncbi:hypothetical protein KLA_13109 [Cellulophaga geojensis KL-A]|uniref:DUF2281 domain-containing protein n=1 Tax=Cellulophaga geojensis KL-A TaxID=1328323 RepID=A0ABN0RLH9_9FLAO|nr:hypothetical protein KLA_13109 [Cellulophaga geojensis KL-A]